MPTARVLTDMLPNRVDLRAEHMKVAFQRHSDQLPKPNVAGSSPVTRFSAPVEAPGRGSLAAYIARRGFGYRARSIAASLGYGVSSSVAHAVRTVESDRRRLRDAKRLVRRCEG